MVQIGARSQITSPGKITADIIAFELGITNTRTCIDRAAWLLYNQNGSSHMEECTSRRGVGVSGLPLAPPSGLAVLHLPVRSLWRGSALVFLCEILPDWSNVWIALSHSISSTSSYAVWQGERVRMVLNHKMVFPPLWQCHASRQRADCRSVKPSLATVQSPFLRSCCSLLLLLYCGIRKRQTEFSRQIWRVTAVPFLFP